MLRCKIILEIVMLTTMLGGVGAAAPQRYRKRP
jgi:hypothetical protein